MAGKAETFGKPMFWVTLLCLIFFLSTMAAVLRTHLPSQDPFEESIQSQNILIKVSRLLSQLKDAETSQQVYIMTGSEEYLAPFNKTTGSFRREVLAIQVETIHNPYQQEKLIIIKRLIHQRLAELNHTIDLRKNLGMGAAMQVIQADQGENLMGDIRRVAMEIKQEERRMVVERQKNANTTDQTAAIGLFAGATLTLILAALIFFKMRRDLLERQRTITKSQAETEAIIAGMMDPLITVDEQDLIELFNPAAEITFGYSASEVIGKNIKMLIPEPYHSDHDGYLSTYGKTGQAKMIGIGREVVGQRKDGTTFPLDLAINEANVGGQRRFIGTYRDITERKRVEDQLQLTQFTVDHNADPIYWVRSDSGIAYANDAACQKLGYTRHELTSMSVPQIDPDFPADVWPTHWREMKEAGSMSFEAHHRTKAGHIIPVDIRTSFIVYVGQEYIVAYARDITERKQVEEKILRFNRIIDRSLNEIYIFDSATLRFINVNLGAQTNLGYSMEELQNMTPMDIKPEFTAESFGRLVEPLRSGAKPRIIFTTVHRRKDGTLYPVEVHLQLMHEEPPVFAAIILDITERKQMEERLRKLVQAVEQSSETVMITNLDAEIEYVNKTFVRLTGYSAEEVIGQNPRLLNSGKTPPATFAAMWDALTHGRPWKGEFHNRKKDGTDFIAFAIISPIRQPDGTVTHYVSVQEDITEKKRLGQELDTHRHHLEELVTNRTTELAKARDDAEAANRAKSQFLSTMSHELRTPLNAILGFGDLLQGQHFGELNPKQEGHVAHILTSGQHLLDLINDLLDIAKIDAGALTLDLEVLSVEEHLANAVALMSSQFKKEDIEVKIHIDPAVTTMTGDPRKFKQIMLNLLSNAMKYTPGKGRIDIRAEPDDDHVRLSVTDNGIGIKQEDQEKIFDEFIQVDRVRDENLGGTGIGLALTRRLVALHGGEIGVDSAPGKGSTFWFTLPLKSLSETKQALEADPQPAGTPRVTQHRILVVEDNEANISMMQDALSIGGHQVSVARNGREAIDLAVSEKPELIFMDIRMPVMDGLEATRKLRAIPEFATIPIIALTAIVGEESKSRVLDAGCTGYLSKPVQISELLEVLDRYL